VHDDNYFPKISYRTSSRAIAGGCF